MTPEQKLSLHALDLTQSSPRSPREMLGGLVIAARTLDKGRAFLLEQNGEYNFGGLLDMYLLDFVGLTLDQFREQISTGASDDEMAIWLEKQTSNKESIEIIRWNNQMRDKRLSELPDKSQMFLEEYVPRVIPANRRVYCWFDVYDIEEGRI